MSIHVLLQAKRKPRVQHDDESLEIKKYVANLNQQLEGYGKIVVYWSRRAVAYLLPADDREKGSKPKQARRHLEVFQPWT